MQAICPHCGFTGTLKDSMVPDAGRTVDCLQCKKPFFVKKGQDGVGIAPDALADVPPAPKATAAPPVDRPKPASAGPTPPPSRDAAPPKKEKPVKAPPPPAPDPLPAATTAPPQAAPPAVGETAPAPPVDRPKAAPAPPPARDTAPVKKEAPAPPPPAAGGAPAESREDARKPTPPAEDAVPHREAAGPPRPILVPKKASPGFDLATLIIPVVTALVFLVIGFFGGYTYHRNRVPVRELLIPVGEETVATPAAPATPGSDNDARSPAPRGAAGRRPAMSGRVHKREDGRDPDDIEGIEHHPAEQIRGGPIGDAHLPQ